MPVRTLADAGPIAADAVVVGHITIDRFDDGREALGGAALYGGLLYARAGLGATVVTAGDPAELADRLGALADELDVVVEPAPAGTRFGISGSGAARVLSVLERAPDVPRADVEARILHLAPVAREVAPDWADAGARTGALVGLTPQGLLREWGEDGIVVLRASPDTRAYRADVIVLDEREAACAPDLADRWRDGSVVVVTRGDGPACARRAGESLDVAANPAQAVDDTGAGDVFAAALLLALSERRALEPAVAFAHAAAAVHVEGIGPGAVPTRTEVEERLAANARRG